MTCPSSIFCIMKIHRLGPGSNPQHWELKASDKPTMPPSQLNSLLVFSIFQIAVENLTNIKAPSRPQEWATEPVNWRRNEWSNVLFSDESRFSVHPDNRRIFIWRDRGSRNNPAFMHESVRFGGTGVLVYGGISIDGCTDLYIIRDGTLTARRYRDEILRPIVVPYAAAIGDDFILMDDNCSPHRANLVEDFLFEEGIMRMEWPGCSSDMNPIEHVWDALGRRVAGRQIPPQTLQELERALLEKWYRIPQLVINSLIDSMPQRCSTLLAVRGNHTPY
ncbi:transposable element Tcb1 transposase [Trichonephila clavipes]|nr:transposable element Tcb1 transposase [Trichonephila clavipes]